MATNEKCSPRIVQAAGNISTMCTGCCCCCCCCCCARHVLYRLLVLFRLCVQVVVAAAASKICLFACRSFVRSFAFEAFVTLAPSRGGRWMRSPWDHSSLIIESTLEYSSTRETNALSTFLLCFAEFTGCSALDDSNWSAGFSLGLSRFAGAVRVVHCVLLGATAA